MNLVFVTSDDAEIRINFYNSGQSWSDVGTNAVSVYVPQNKVSMNFGWFDQNTLEAEFSRVILHEFGHAMEIIHKLSRLNQNIQWNYPAFYAYYGGYPNYFTTQQVDDWVLTCFSQIQTKSSTYDPQSIMLYPVPVELTLNGFSVGWNYYLSNTDKVHLGNVYTYPPGSQNVVTVYKHDNFNPSGYAIGLPIGDYTLNQLQARGILNDDISSLKVISGCKVTIYHDDFFQNFALTFYADQLNFYNINGWNFNDLTSSIKIARL